jgi:hypothetical protein
MKIFRVTFYVDDDSAYITPYYQYRETLMQSLEKDRRHILAAIINRVELDKASPCLVNAETFVCAEADEFYDRCLHQLLNGDNSFEDEMTFENFVTVRLQEREVIEDLQD